MNLRSLITHRPVRDFAAAQRARFARAAETPKRAPMYQFTYVRRALLVAAVLITLGMGVRMATMPVAAGQSAGFEQATTGKLAVVGAQSADVMDAPDGQLLHNLPPGATVTARGRSADGRWIFVTMDDGAAGWVETPRLVIFGADQLPVMAEAETATTLTPTPLSSPAAEASPTTSVMTATVTAPVTPRPNTPTHTPTAPPSPTATPTPSPTASPTASPTPSPTPSPSPSPSPTSTPTAALLAVAPSEVIAVVGADGATLSAQPAGETGRALSVGTTLTAKGRSGDGGWLYVESGDGVSGWVATDAVVAFNVRGLPILDAEGAVVAVEVPPSDEPSAAGGRGGGEDEPAMSVTGAVTVTVALTTTPPVAATPALRTVAADSEQPTARIAMSGSRLNVRAGPGVQYAIIDKALPNETFLALARNGPADWVQIELGSAPDGFGWVSAPFVELTIPVVDLPISDRTSSAPAPTATPSPMPAPSTLTGADEASGVTTVASTQPVVRQTGPTGLSGKLVVQTRAGGLFYLYDLASGAVRPLTSGLDPSISPDGAQVAFTRLGDNPGLYLINVDGGNERMVFNGREGLRAPKWSPDGKYIVFSRADGEYKCRDLGFAGLCPSDSQLVSDVPDIEIPEDQAPPGCDEDCLEELAEGIEGSIKSRILNQFDRVTKPNWMIARVSVDGRDYRDLAALNSALAPDWNEAGIVYQSADGLQRTSNAPDAETRRVYFDYDIYDPDWQPGGGRIAFHSRRGSHWQIFTVNPDGTGVTHLTQPRTTLVNQIPSNVAPAWSPDGQHIVFLSNREDNHEAGRWRVWVMNADGGNQRPLPIDLPIEYSYSHEQMVDWGP